MAIDAMARVADGARIGDGVEVGPYCVVGPHVELKYGVRLLAYCKRVDSDNWRVSSEAVGRRPASGNPRRQLTCRSCGFAQRRFAGEK